MSIEVQWHLLIHPHALVITLFKHTCFSDQRVDQPELSLREEKRSNPLDTLPPQWTSSKPATIETGKKKKKKVRNCLNTPQTGNGGKCHIYISVLFTLWGAKMKQPCAQMFQVESEVEPHMFSERKG